MAVHDFTDDQQESSSSSAPTNSSSSPPVISGISGTQQQNASRVDLPTSGFDYVLAIFGCTGNGEVAVKLNSTVSTAMTLADPAASSGSVGIVDNQALWLWDEDAETVLLAWAVVDVKLNKVW